LVQVVQVELAHRVGLMVQIQSSAQLHQLVVVEVECKLATLVHQEDLAEVAAAGMELVFRLILLEQEPHLQFKVTMAETAAMILEQLLVAAAAAELGPLELIIILQLVATVEVVFHLQLQAHQFSVLAAAEVL
jgi:hypothetical protein